MKSLLIAFFLCLPLFAQDFTTVKMPLPQDTVRDSSLGSILVKTDDGRVLPVYIDGKKVGQTPYLARNLRPRRYSVSFFNPQVREQILNDRYRGYKSRGGLDITCCMGPCNAVCFGMGQKLFSSGAVSMQMANSEYARISNQYAYVKPGQQATVVFMVGEADRYIKSEKGKGTIKVIIGGTLIVAIIGTLFFGFIL
jgi:hypothetical protein